MNILDKIITDKRKEVEAIKKILPVQFLQKSPMFSRSTVALSESIKSEKAC